MRPISLNSLILAFSKTIDLLDKKLHRHHWTVAYIGMQIAKRMNCSEDTIQRVIQASLLHDIGIFKADDRRKLLEYNDIETVGHEQIGALLLEEADVLTHLAPIIRDHHLANNLWTENTPIEAGIIYLADRISVLVDGSGDATSNYEHIVNIIEKDRDKKFCGRCIDAFKDAAKNTYFWLDIRLNRHEQRIREGLIHDEIIYSFDRLMTIGHLFISAVDFRSRYTAAHSYGVAQVAQLIGQFMGMNEADQEFLALAGFYHDIGKIAIPKEILDKPTALTTTEKSIILGHSYFTFDILASVDGLADYAKAAAYHHEHLDGSGYPFGVDEGQLDLASRILAVADILTAITEMRPYRQPISNQDAIAILRESVDDSKIDEAVATVAIEHFDQLLQSNKAVQQNAYRRFDHFEREVFRRTGINLKAQQLR